jgi:hypothetical protein
MRLLSYPFPSFAPSDSARRLSVYKIEKATEGHLFLLEKDAEYSMDSSFGL